MSINVKNNRRRCYVYERTRSHSWILFLGEIVGGCYNPTFRQEEASTSVTESIATDSWLSTAAYTEEGSVGDSENLSTDVTNLCPKATLDHYKIMAGEPLTVGDPAMGLLTNDEDVDGGSLLISNFDSHLSKTEQFRWIQLEHLYLPIE